MVILVVFNSFNMVKNLKKLDLVACQKPPFYTTIILFIFKALTPQEETLLGNPSDFKVFHRSLGLEIDSVNLF